MVTTKHKNYVDPLRFLKPLGMRDHTTSRVTIPFNIRSHWSLNAKISGAQLDLKGREKVDE